MHLLVESKILNRPEILPLVLNRAMLAGMMFCQQPKRVLLAGVGGGATARYFAGCFPEVIGEAVEISETVSQLAKDFFEFPMSKKWQLITENILDYMSSCQQQYDVIIVDIAVEQATPEWLVEQGFLQQCRAMLTENGQLSLNLLVDNDDDFKRCVSTIRDVFDRQTVCLSLASHRNTVIFAFNNKPQILPAELDKHIPILESLWGLEFGEFYQQMLKDNPVDSGIF